ncbi:hypothetical protein, partial [Klebsiella pneumoniae]|uniref:hypothetical protein n=1 Tax=Klebsiella pneumoniae TaxID=573 RepID=UPI0019544F83
HSIAAVRWKRGRRLSDKFLPAVDKNTLFWPAQSDNPPSGGDDAHHLTAEKRNLSRRWSKRGETG